MLVDKRLVGWVVIGAGLGAVLRSVIAPAWTGTPGLVAVGVMTVAGGLLAGVALGLRGGRAAALVMGVASGTASSGLYAVWGVTAAPKTGIVFLITVPVATAAALTLGVSAVGILRRRDRTEVAH
ncbi:hypothetical protein [Mycolicibacterium sp.]|uniref:hypothetical protein n=1 Tax=Mycolicibacterium sp. TaxID=2320850 RepID=UPI001A26F7E4|nr:hypothetical protein [Mycolicibacterium sp.]MBJ7339076.1 hypothetical protein [Mycolicibacterium sp.]